MKKMTAFLLLSFILAFVSTGFCAKGTPEEAKTMVEKASAYLKAQGKEKAFAEFDNTQGQFRKGELYIFVVSMNGDILAHGAKRKMVGKGSPELTDPDGKLFMKEIVEAAKARNSGWVAYKWTNPESKKVGEKNTYFQKVDDVIVCCGAYKK